MRNKLAVIPFLLLMMLLSACGSAAGTPGQTVFQETVPAGEYITTDGKERELVGTVTLNAGYTQDNLVQFTDVYDFGLRDERPLGFSGKVYLNGKELESGDFRFDGYPDNTTIVLKLYSDLHLTGNVLTVAADSVIYYDKEAVLVEGDFHARWDGEKWTAAEPDLQSGDF